MMATARAVTDAVQIVRRSKLDGSAHPKCVSCLRAINVRRARLLRKVRDAKTARQARTKQRRGLGRACRVPLIPIA